ncbi:hypothetical protein GE115_06270 [Agromyces sp. CFH 90414]|uniref:DUF559 domain-containing protein n=1 Tax=Agromyces agglutinans TaxID=2662258 RepID=A0A6I2FEI5_9MICO|nr:hypothetical protein [Agromyces agglutinans]MRG59478.1 hypothetical protein [Agromyces agglutinans]
MVGHTTERPVETRSINGVRVVGPIAAWIGLCGLVGIDDLVAAGDRLIGLPYRLAAIEEIDAAVLAHAWRRGARDLRAARGLIRADVYSPRETRLRLLVTRAGYREPEPNGRIRLANGRVFRGDLVFRAERVLLEYEGDHHRTDATQWARDLDRYNSLAAAGWIVVRLSGRMSDREVLAAVGRAFEAARA